MFVSYFTLCPLFIQFTAFTYSNTFSGLFTSRTGVKIKILLYDGSEQYADLAFAGQALIKGFLCFFPVILCSMIFALIGFVSELKKINLYAYLVIRPSPFVMTGIILYLCRDS